MKYNKLSRRLGQKAFYLQFILIIVFAVIEIASSFLGFTVRLDAWKIILASSSALLTIVWGGIASKNLKKTVNNNVSAGGN